MLLSFGISIKTLTWPVFGSFPAEKIGVVSSGEIVVDGDFWGTIDWWKDRYDEAIENYLSKEEAGSALSSI